MSKIFCEDLLICLLKIIKDLVILWWVQQLIKIIEKRLSNKEFEIWTVLIPCFFERFEEETEIFFNWKIFRKFYLISILIFNKFNEFMMSEKLLKIIFIIVHIQTLQ